MIGISAGNHAQALAWGAVAEGIDCLVVMWEGASEAKIAATRGYGAAVDLGAADPAEAFERLDALIAETGRTLVHPFDDPVVIAGPGTVALELLEDVPEIETIVVPAGGGGLVAGIAAAAPDRRVIAVEPERSTAVHERAGGRTVGTGDAGLDRRRALRPVRRRARARDPRGARGREHPRHGGGDRGGVSVPLRAGEAGLRTGCGRRSRGDPGRQDRHGATESASVVSGGNVAAETASAILASR